MEVIHDFYKNLDKVIDIYNFAIEYWSMTKPGIRVQRLYKVELGDLAIFRMNVNSMASSIARTNEIINDLESTIEKEEYNKKIDSFIESLGFFDKIESLVELTHDEKRQKIKNCLAHSNFKIVEDTEGKTIYDRYKILIENEYIKGKISLIELEELKRFYTTLSDELDKNKVMYTGLANLFYINTNNNKCLEEAISRVAISKKEQDILEKAPRNATFLQFYKLLDDDTIEFLSKQQQDLIKNYIKYIGINNWIDLPLDKKTSLFGRHIKFMLKNEVDFRQNNEYVLALINYLLSGDEQNIINKISAFSYEAPFAYVSSILDLGYFCFNYLREAHKKDSLEGFDFHNFNLKGIKYNSPFEPSEKFIDESVVVNNLLMEEENKKKKINATITSLETNKINLEKVTTIPEEKKNHLLSQNNNSRIQKYEELKQTEIKINELKEKLKTAKSYTDSSNFFRHLRNSFAHGFYTVDYSKALKNKNLGNIVFHFRDYNIDSNNRSNRVMCFEAEMSASRLIDLLNDFGTRIKKSDDVKCEPVERVFVKTTGNDKTIEQRVEEVSKVYQKQKIGVTRIPKK